MMLTFHLFYAFKLPKMYFNETVVVNNKRKASHVQYHTLSLIEILWKH